MQYMNITRRIAILGAVASLGGCGALSTINAAAVPIDTYELAPVPGSATGRRTGRTLVVVRPDARASIASDRIMVRPGGAAVTYLPDARWTDDLPEVVQSLLIRSIAGTGRMGYVGTSEGGPVPDRALLTRIDSFEVDIADTAVTVRVNISLTMLSDRDQRVIRTRTFGNQIAAASDEPAAVIAAFQAILDTLLPEMANWAVTA